MSTYKANRAAPVVVQTRDVLEALAGMRRATGSIAFAANASDTETLSVHGSVFEFLEDLGDLTEGNIGVLLGQDAEETRDALLTALGELPRSNSQFALVVATATGDGDEIDFGVALEYWEVGTVGDSTIVTDSQSLTVSGMSGGADGGTLQVLADVLDVDIAGLVTGIAGNKTLADIYARLIAAPATEAQIGATTNPAAGTSNKLLTDMLAKIIAAPATEAKQGAGLPAALGAGGGLKVEASGTTWKSSGVTALATTTDSAVEAIAADAVNVLHHVKLVNEGAVAGHFSIDGGTTWGRLPSDSMFVLDGVKIANAAIQVKRVAGGANLSGVFVEAW